MKSSQHILVVEDEESVRVMLAKYLEAKGYQVTAVVHGGEALAALGSDASFDLVLLDVNMPQVSGFDVLRAARVGGITAPIIMATAAASAEDIVRALGMGADDYITKPFSYPVLLARIEARIRVRPVGLPTAPPPNLNDTTRDSTVRPPEGGLLARFKTMAQRLKQSASQTPQLAPGTTVGGRYRIKSRLGAGAFGTVFRARHIDLEQDVALKVLTANSEEGTVDAFRREAQSACRVRHPNAVRVFDFGLIPGGSAFLVMEMLEGPTLDRILAEHGPMRLHAAAPIMRAVLSALGAVHKQGLVHRDVKPANVILHTEDGGREVPKLVDFGVARAIDDQLSADDPTAGSPAYLSPERIKGEPYDGRADVYACGISFYKLLTGTLPLDVDLHDHEQILRWHVETVAKPPSTKNPLLSKAVDDLVLKLLEKDVSKRPTAAEAETLLDTLIWE